MRFLTRILLALGLLLFVILGISLIDSKISIHSYLPFIKSADSDRGAVDSMQVAPYHYGKTLPIALGEIDNPDNAYIHLKFRFRADSTEGNPNVFQTAPFNFGMRMEISGSTATILVPDLLVPGGLKGLTLSTVFKPGKWHTLEVEALNKAFVRIAMDNHLITHFTSTGLSIATSQLLVGGGFDASRVFHGQITDISVTKGHLPQSKPLFFSSLSNKNILLFSCACFFIFILLKMALRRSLTNFFLPQQMSVMTQRMFVLIQLLLFVMLPAYRNVVIVYLFLFFIGFNQYLLLTPEFFKEKFSYFILAPLQGLLLLSVLGAYVIGFSFNIDLLVPMLLCISLMMYLLNFKFNRNSLILNFSEMKKDYSMALAVYSLAITPMILCLLFPVLLTNDATSPYRFGPDMASYTKISQYLLDGGTWNDGLRRASEFTGMSVGDINRYSDATLSWPLMYYFRWGLTAFQAVVVKITFSKHSLETAFISMALPYFLMCGLVFIWLKNKMRLETVAVLLGVAAFAFNANRLNLWYEGFYGNAYSLIFFIPILYLFLHLRSKEKHTVSDITKSILFSSLLFAASLLSYAEGIVFVLAPFIIVLFIIDYVINKKIHYMPYLTWLCSAGIAVILVLPCGFMVKWVSLAIKQITQEGGNGYAQPVWAFPHEILGLQNIYLSMPIEFLGKLLPRTNLNLVYGFIISGLIFYFIYVYLRKNRNAENVLFIASIMMVATAFGLVYYQTPNNNYIYMKMYLFYLPILFILFWGSANTWYETQGKKLFMVPSKWLNFFLATPMVISGMIYIIQYQEQSISVEKFRMALHDEIKQINFNNVIMYPFFTSKINSIMYIQNRNIHASIAPTPWMISDLWNSIYWKDKPYYKNFMNHKVYLFVEKKQGDSCQVENGTVIFQNQNYLIIDSNKLVKDGINRKNHSIDFNIYSYEIICHAKSAYQYW